MSVNVHMAIRTTRTGQNALLSHLKALLTLQVASYLFMVSLTHLFEQWVSSLFTLNFNFMPQRFNHNLAEAGPQAELDANVGSDSVSQPG